LILPPVTQIGNPAEDTLLPRTIAELKRLGISPKEVALDGGFNIGATREAFEDLAPDRCSSLAVNNPAAGVRNDGFRSTEPGPRDGSATLNAATTWTAPASKATKASRSGTDGRSWRTTLTRSPSGSGETLPGWLEPEPTH
jgi:hypothetical protein